MRQMDLTQGVIWKNLIVYAGPVVLSSLLQSAYSITDLIVAGWFIGKDGISAINNAGQVMTILTQIIMGITIGGNILMGQYFGSRQHDQRKQTDRTLFSFSLLAGVGMLGVVFLLSRPILLALHAPALDQAQAYLQVCAFGLPAIFGYNAMAAMLRSVGDSKQPFYCVAVTAGCNIVLDCLFMGAFQWGVEGAALATVLAQWASFLFCSVYVQRHKGLFGLERRLSIQRDKLGKMLKLGIPSAIQMTVVGLSWLAMTFLINHYGVEASAASGICAKIKDVSLMFTLALYTAATTMVAQCLGARKFDRASRVVHVAMRFSLGVTAVLILLIQLLAPQILAIFHPDQVTMDIALENLRIEILGQIFYASFMVYNALPMGAGHTLFALGSSLLNCIVVRVVLALILDRYFGLTGIFWACAIAPASSVPLGYIYEHRGKWRRSLAEPKKE
ncbi:MAG TPA: MATE family efflux transporter [Candidatus Evtepia faecigallinarum]|nr:MATE family efflux transporter [Candidatus Evtepia faecigallinarum]